MTRVVILGLVCGLAGCGSTIGAFDGLPAGPDVTESAWPRLVDTPAPPDDRLVAGTGEQAAARLGAQRVQAEARAARANQVAPVSETLAARGKTNLARTGDAGPGFDETDLRARAAPIDDGALQARAALVRARTSAPPATSSIITGAQVRRPVPLRPLDTPVVSDSFEERARLARERAARAGR